jgi:cobalamin synthase
VSDPWRLFVAALRLDLRGPGTAQTAARLVPLAGIVVGAAGGAVYWLASQLWPASIAVILAVLTTSAVGAASADAFAGRPSVAPVFWVLIKYNALIALSAAKLPFVVPEHLTVGLLMIAGQAASRALVVSVMAGDAAAADRVGAPELAFALALGAAPGALLGIPGLTGLAAALGLRLGYGVWRPVSLRRPAAALEFTQQATEICFYLGALASWKYV